MVKDNASTLEEQSGIPLSSPVIMAAEKIADQIKKTL